MDYFQILRNSFHVERLLGSSRIGPLLERSIVGGASIGDIPALAIKLEEELKGAVSLWHDANPLAARVVRIVIPQV